MTHGKTMSAFFCGMTLVIALDYLFEGRFGLAAFAFFGVFINGIAWYGSQT